MADEARNPKKPAAQAEKCAALDAAKQQAEADANARVARVEAIMEPENTPEAVVAPNVYNTMSEFPKWLYHRTTQEKRIFDNLAEFEERVPEDDKANWTADPFTGVSDGYLRSPATGGASDPALRAAAQPNVVNTDPPAKLPEQVQDSTERVTLEPRRLRDPQRVEAVRDSQAR